MGKGENMGDTWGVLAMVGMIVFGIAWYATNRLNNDISKGPRLILEGLLAGVFVLCLGAGGAWVANPDGWLKMTTPTIETVGRHVTE